MAFITYRVSTSPTVPTSTTAKGLQLLNTEVDGNFKSLDVSKLETNGSAASLTGLPLTTGVTGTLPVANGGTGSTTASTGSGGVVLATSPTLVTPNLGTPAYLNLAYAINFPLDGTATVTGKLPILFGGTNATATPTAGAVPYGTGTAYAFTGVGTAGQVLTSAGAGTPTWTTVTTSAGGSNTQLQYNSSGSFAGSANMTFNGTTLSIASGLVGSNANFTDFPNARFVSSQANTGDSHIYNAGVAGEGVATDIAGGGQWGVGVYGVGATTGSTRGIGIVGDGAVSSSSDPGASIGVRGYATNTHSGGQNIGLYAQATGGGTNFALFMASGNIYSAVAQTWSLSDNETSALSFDTTGKAGVLKIITTDAAEGVTMSGTLGVTGTTLHTGKVTTLAQVETPDVTSLLTTANTYPTTRPSLNLDFANSATLDPRITFTRGTNATYTGSDGLVKNTVGIHSPRFDWDPVTRECKGLLIEEARTNLLTYSNNLDNATWSKWGGATATLNTIVAPDGSTGAVTIIIPAGAGIFQSASTAASTTYTLSCWIRGNTTQTVSFVANTSLSEVSVITVTITTTWQRITLVKPTTTGTLITFQFYQSSTGAPFQVWGAQLELGAFATSYIPSLVTWTGRTSTATYVGSNGLIQTAASGVARYQYNPTNLSVAPFLLLEPAATNLLTYSDDTSAYGYIDNSSIVVNQIAAPDGNTTADKIVSTLTGGSNNCYVQKTASVVADTQTYTFSVFVKAGTSPTTTLNLQLGGGTYQQVVGIITWATNTISTGTLVNYGNGWFKASVTLTNNGTNTVISPRIYVRDQSTANVSGEYEYIWGWQVETGSVATSYIPTVASQVTRIADTSTSAQTTRSADVATMTNSNFSSWYNQTEGTLFAQYDSFTTNVAGVYAANDTSASNRIDLRANQSGKVAMFVSSNGTNQFVQSGGTFSTNTFVKSANAYAASSFAQYADGSLQGSVGASGTVPITTTLSIGRIDTGTNYLNGHIKRLTYYPTRLSNSTLQALTT